MRPRPTRPTVHKFGGAALSDASSILRAMAIFQQQPAPGVVVVSAIAGITDLLVSALESSSTGALHDALSASASFEARHRQVIEQLMLDDTVQRLVTDDHREIEILLRDVATSRIVTTVQRDWLLARGELLSGAIVTAVLNQQGVESVLVNPVDVIITDGPHGNAVPNQAATRAAVQRRLTPLLLQGRTPVVPGFLGSAPDGTIATLGRGGTDLTATLLGRATDAAAVVLWKDVPGLLTADPRDVADARLVPEAHRLEAAELAWYGARILHPRALVPLTGTRIPVSLRPFADPESEGTVISARRDFAASPVRGLAAVRQQTLLTISGSGVIGVPGIAATAFAALHARDIPVSLVTQASAEAGIDCIVPTALADEAVRVLRNTLRADIQRGEIDGVERRDHVAVVAVVGLGMAHHAGVAAKAFDALADAGINIVAIAQSSGERNISIVLVESDAAEALRRIHDAFQLGKLGGGRPLRRAGRDVILLGAGTIGRSVLTLLAMHAQAFARLRIVAVLDSSGAILDSEGITPERLAAIAAAKGDGVRLADQASGTSGSPDVVLNSLFDRALVRPMLADMTAADTGSLLRAAAASGWDLVLANKQPLAAPTADVEALRDLLRQRHVRMRYEATVGAGLPVVEALQQLLATGDRVRSLEGCLSGTLGVVLSALQSGTPFSVAVRDARSSGFTEPDPRDDLGGVDVARKALILARTLGLRHELTEISIDSLVRRGESLGTDAWLEQLPDDDDYWRARVADASARGQVLRYVATITPLSVAVGLRELPASHPLAQLQGATNQLVFTSDRYAVSPLIITGPGAGPEVTATGVLADLLALAS